ncbi:hypothetical protein CC80DRAFT_506668 [Byssothecium circinans]|uniref:Uncharacterized protein n=1 Tax=Byssothecium circinans TaxID=147558 RepID=A0A6A5TNN6_9PLEO|nr:hypothetical protein CC80DRAFT_506668 [Byssothecium circinans]
MSTKQEYKIDSASCAPVAELYKTDPAAGAKAANELMRDKFIAFDQDKADFVYQLILAKGAKYIVEDETSDGVSTIYLALAVAEVERVHGGEKGKIVTTEHEKDNCETAREYWKECRVEVESHIDLRQGDCVKTFAQDVDMIDFLLLDCKFYGDIVMQKGAAAFPNKDSVATCRVSYAQSPASEIEARAIAIIDSTNDLDTRNPALLEVLRDPNEA